MNTSPLADLTPALLADLLLGTVANSADLAVLETALGDRALVARALGAYPASAVMTLRYNVAHSPSTTWLAERLGARYEPQRERFCRADGSRVTTQGGVLHSINDRPAVAGRRSALWYTDGSLHRGGDRVAAVRLDLLHHAFHSPHQRNYIFETNHLGHGQLCAIFEWREHGRRHRDRDRPAVVTATLDGKCLFVYWMRDGLLHRGRDRPAAVEYAREEGGATAGPFRVVGRYWYRRGELHRSHGRPSADRPGCLRMWHRNGAPYRADDLPTTVVLTGRNAGLRWENQRGERHRDGGLPAVVYLSGMCWWMRGGNPHRMAGMPALVDGGRNRHCEWFMLGRPLAPPANFNFDVAFRDARAFVRSAQRVIAAESAAAAAD
jgi:hypothetical protein